MHTDELLECHGVGKRWSRGDGQPPALDAVDLVVRAGEIHVLLGENGAGKSTLVKILAGVVAADSGSVSVRGRKLPNGSVSSAQAAGISLIHQEPRLFGDLDVVDNLFLGSLPRRRWGLGIDRRRAAMRARAVLDEVGCAVPLDAPVREFSVADQQLIDIASALLRDPSVLIVDEPTASLTPVEVTRLFEILRRLRDRGVGIVFIGHRLEEIMAISDRITVLRDGRKVAELMTAHTSEPELVRLMVDREQQQRLPRTPTAERTRVVLDVSGLSSAGAFRDVTVQVRAGEIVGLAGLVGAGRSEVAEAIFGVRERSAGSVTGPDGSHPRTADAAVRAGIAFVPEDRGRQGLVLSQSLSENITGTIIGSLARSGIRRSRRERAVAYEAIARLGVVCRGPDQRAGELSGGNQQKVSLAKWMVTRPGVLIVDEPTRGVDVGAKAEIHRILGELAADGVGILLISSELAEVLALADRVLVMREGRVVGELSRDEADEHTVITLATSAAPLVPA